VDSDDPQYWPIQPQGLNECGCAAPANAMNLLLGECRFDKDQLVREAGIWFQRTVLGKAGGSPSFVTDWLIKGHGFGTHFGSLRKTNAEEVLRALIDRGIPSVVEIGSNKLGPFTVWGQHSIVIVGYSDPYFDAQGRHIEEYYFVDSQYPADLRGFGLETNDVDRDGDGRPEHYPGNRSIERSDFLRSFPTRIYHPVFRSQTEHDAWAAVHLNTAGRLPVAGLVSTTLLTGSYDLWRG
jgi:hypothetical protein